MPAARTKVVLITCALLVLPGYRLLFFEQPLHGHGKHRMRSVITLTSAHLIPHSFWSHPPLPQLYLTHWLALCCGDRVLSAKIFMLLLIDANVDAKPADTQLELAWSFVDVCQACAYCDVERSKAVRMGWRP